MRETAKAHGRRAKAGYFRQYLRGRGIDVGCGDDVLQISDGTVLPYDRIIDSNHDAQRLTGIDDESFDFLYSSNCLEHVDQPSDAMANWIRVVKPGGFVFFTVPDEDLYEQGMWPSRYNPDHKWSLTIDKPVATMPRSINIRPWLQRFNDRVDVVSILLIDTMYDHSVSRVDQTLGEAEAFIEVILKKRGNESRVT